MPRGPAYRGAAAPERLHAGMGKARRSCGLRMAGVSAKLLLLEIPQIRRLLALGGRHQEAIGADHVILSADPHVIVGFRTILFIPCRITRRLAPVVLKGRSM